MCTCVGKILYYIVNRSMLITESLLCFNWSALGLYCTKCNYCKWSVFSDPVTYVHVELALHHIVNVQGQ